MATTINHQPRVRDGHRIYAVGDVHGCFDELVSLLDRIEEDHRSRSEAKCFIIFLGDLIDRGPKSRHVVQHLLNTPPAFAKMEFIRGNHEEMAVRALTGDPMLIPDWIQYGGLEFAISYGLDPGQMTFQSPEKIQRLLLDVVPKEDIAFLASGADWIASGDYMFVHAGVRPGVPLDQQSGRDLRWIRSGFIDSSEDFGAVIVHGHTISNTVEIRPNRIAMDTGAYRTGKLSAIRLEADGREVLSTLE